jgi:competence protein ComEC
VKRIKKLLMLIAISALWLTATPAQSPTPQMRVHYIDVGQADSILLEFDKSALLIDAGGETTADQAESPHLVDYLTRFFQRRADLGKTIHTVIISHPHIDHTMKLMDVMTKFTVKNLIDGGEESERASGLPPLRHAREHVKSQGGNYFTVKDADVITPRFENPALKSLQEANPGLEVKFLSGGGRGCHNENNDSLVVLVSYQGARFIFTGDAEIEGDHQCRPGILELLARHKDTGQLRADVYKVGHHGSPNGTEEEWVKAIRPRISVISAGKSDLRHRGPNRFHAFEFGHPREAAVKIIEANTSGKRAPAATVITLDKVEAEHKNRKMAKAVYCTCWDGNIVVEVGADGKKLEVKTNQ